MPSTLFSTKRLFIFSKGFPMRTAGVRVLTLREAHQPPVEWWLSMNRVITPPFFLMYSLASGLIINIADFLLYSLILPM